MRSGADELGVAQIHHDDGLAVRQMQVQAVLVEPLRVVGPQGGLQVVMDRLE